MAPLKESRASAATLGAVLAHPLRSRCLTILTERTASPAELSRQLLVEVSKVSYHVRQLEKMGAVELVETRPVRGAVEHFYRAIQRPLVDDEGYKDLTCEERTEIGRQVVQLTMADVETSMKEEVFGRRFDHHVSRVPVIVDERGWEELRDIHAEALERVLDVQARSAERISGDADAEGFPARVVAMVFEMPAGRSPAPDAPTRTRPR